MKVKDLKKWLNELDEEAFIQITTDDRFFEDIKHVQVREFDESTVVILSNRIKRNCPICGQEVENGNDGMMEHYTTCEG